MGYGCRLQTWLADMGCGHGWQMWLVNAVHKTQSMNPVCKHGLQIWSITVHKPKLGQVRSGQVTCLLPFHYWFTVILLLVYPYLTIGLFLSHYRSHSIAKWALQAKCIVTTNQNVWHYKSKCMGITNKMYDHYKPKSMGITN